MTDFERIVEYNMMIQHFFALPEASRTAFNFEARRLETTSFNGPDTSCTTQ